MPLADRSEVAADTFGSEIGAGWTNPDATGDVLVWVTGGFVQPSAGNTDCDAGRASGTYDDEQYSTIVIEAHSASGNNFVSATCQNQGSNAYLGTVETAGTDEYRIQVYSPFSTLANAAGGPMSAGDTVTLEVRDNGAVQDLELFTDEGGGDTSRLGPTTTAVDLTGGRPGVFLRASTAADARVTAWSGGDLVEGGAQTITVTTPLGAAVSLPQGTASPGGVSVTPPVLAAQASLPQGAANPGEVTVTAPVLGAAVSLPQGAANPGAVSLTMPVLSVAASLPPGVVTPGAVTITSGVLSITTSLPSPVASTGGDTIVAPVLTLTASMPQATVSPGAVTVTATVLSIQGTLPSPTATPGAVTLEPGALTVTAVLPGGVLSPGAVTITAPVLSITTSLPRPEIGAPAQSWLLGEVSIMPALRGEVSIQPTLQGEVSIEPTISGDVEVDPDEG